MKKQIVIQNLLAAILHLGPAYYEKTVKGRDYPFLPPELDEMWYSSERISLANCYEYCLGMDEDEAIQTLSEFLLELTRHFFW